MHTLTKYNRNVYQNIVTIVRPLINTMPKSLVKIALKIKKCQKTKNMSENKIGYTNSFLF